MPITDLTALREGIAATAGTISGLRTEAYVPGAITPPTFVVGEMETDFDQAMGRGLDGYRFTCRLYTGLADDRAAQEQLDSYLVGSGAKSIKAAFVADKTLGGTCQTSRLTEIRGHGIYEFAGARYVGAQINLTVWG